MTNEELKKIDDSLKEISTRVVGARNLMEAGKFIQAYNRLQGVITKCITLHVELTGEKLELADSSIQDFPTEVPIPTDGNG